MFHKPVLLFITNFSHGPVSGFGESFRFVGKFPPMQVDRIKVASEYPAKRRHLSDRR